VGRKKKCVASENAETGEKPVSAIVGVKSIAQTILNISSRDESGFVNVSISPGINQVSNALWCRVKDTPIIERLVSLGTIQISS
jgi:hypothetical protein